MQHGQQASPGSVLVLVRPSGSGGAEGRDHGGLDHVLTGLPNLIATTLSTYVARSLPDVVVHRIRGAAADQLADRRQRREYGGRLRLGDCGQDVRTERRRDEVRQARQHVVEDRRDRVLPSALSHGRRAGPGDACWHTARAALLAQLVEHLHGKEGVDGSSPSEGFINPALFVPFHAFCAVCDDNGVGLGDSPGGRANRSPSKTSCRSPTWRRCSSGS